MNLYQEQIIDHYKNPQNWGDLVNANVSVVGNNPLCGDVISIKLKIANGDLIEMRYLAQGCAISIASASLLSEAIKGEKTANIKELRLKDIVKLLGIELGMSRAKCALLPLETLVRGINEYEPPLSEAKIKTKKQYITKEMLLGDLVRKYPYLTETLLKDYGLHCAGCFANTFDTIEGGAKVHGMSEREVEDMIEHLDREVINHQ